MDKLTWYDEDGRLYCRRGYEVALARLASYEATELMPDEIVKMGMMFEDSNCLLYTSYLPARSFSLHRGSPHQCQRGNRSVSTNDRQVRKPSNDSTCPAFRSRNDRG